MKTQKPPLMFILFLLVVLVSVVPGCLNHKNEPANIPTPTLTPTPLPEGESLKQTPPFASRQPADMGAAAFNEGNPQLQPQPQVPRKPDSSHLESGKPLEQKVPAIQGALDKLPEGKFFHTVPSTMEVGQPVIIEAGITESITTQLLAELQGRGTLQSRDGIRYDPKGIEIELSADKSKFDAQPISVGMRPPIVKGEPTVWKWRVTPLQKNTQYLTLIAKVHLLVPGINTLYEQDYVVYSEPVMVQGKISYSLVQLLSKHWLSIFIGLLAASLGLFAWLFALKPKKLNPTEKIDG